MHSLTDRFRRWYDYERDCNARMLAMLRSVPVERQADPLFAKAVEKLAHIQAARQRWLNRLGHWPTAAEVFPQGLSLDAVAAMIADTEAAWASYLGRLDDSALDRHVEYRATEGTYLRWTVEGMLTQTQFHGPYHRGQIAMLVAMLGGQHENTDYVIWSRPEVLPDV